MAEEFQVGVCAGNWWNSPGNLFGSSAVGNLEWPSCHELIMDVKSTARPSTDPDSADSASDGGSVAFQDVTRKTHHQPNDSLKEIGGFSSSPSSTHDREWNQNLIHERNDIYSLNSSMNHGNLDDDSCNNYKAAVQDWNFRTNSSFMGHDQILNQDFPSHNIEQGLDYSYVTSSLLQDLLFGQDSEEIYFCNKNYAAADHEFLQSNQLQLVQPPAAINHFNHFTNSNINTALIWNPAVATDAAVIGDAKFNPSSKPHFISSTEAHDDAGNNILNISSTHHQKNRNDAGRGGLVSSLAKKRSCNEPTLKRTRMETPSPLPTFKVRKEKLVDRITALQQLVSPFGKTDTASVLQEAIDYIKFLHDQVNVLSSPYLENGSHDKLVIEDEGGLKQEDLSGRGLCLVPISVSFAVTAETTSDFWTPTFGGCFS